MCSGKKLTVAMLPTLLILLSLFIVACGDTGVSIPTPTATSTPIPTANSNPVSTPFPHLELSYHEFVLTIDSTGLLNNSQTAINDLKNQVRRQPFLQGRRVGLVIASIGAPDQSQGGTAQNIDQKVYDILRTMPDFDLNRAADYNLLFNLGHPANELTLDVYLFGK